MNDSASTWIEAAAIAGDCYYEHTVTRPALRSALTGRNEADVVVVGGGSAGLHCAIELARAGRRVILLEAARLGSAASGRNGGQVLPGYSADLELLQRQLGKARARQAWDLSLEGMDMVRERATRPGVDCEYRHGWMMLAARAGHVKGLRAWYEELCTELGYGEFVEFCEGEALAKWCSGQGFHAALIDHRSAHLNPLKLMLALADECEALGVTIHEQSPVRSVVSGQRMQIATDAGQIDCRDVVLACNVFVDQLGLPQQRRIMSVGNTMIATEPLPEALASALLRQSYAGCDTNFMLDYFRISSDRRMLWGGASTYLKHDGGDRTRMLYDKMVQRFPQLKSVKIDYTWGGLIDVTASRAPDLGCVGQHLYYMQGFSGHGLNVTAIAARLTCEAILGDVSRYEILSALKHRDFPRGAWLRRLLLSMGTWYFRARDRFD